MEITDRKSFNSVRDVLVHEIGQAAQVGLGLENFLDESPGDPQALKLELLILINAFKQPLATIEMLHDLTDPFPVELDMLTRIMDKDFMQVVEVWKALQDLRTEFLPKDTPLTK